MRKVDKEFSVVPVEDYEHSIAKRKNNPPAGLAHLDRDVTPVTTWEYDPNIDPQLQWAGKIEHDVIEVPAPSIHVHEELSAQKIIGSVRKRRTQESLFDIDVLEPDKAIEFYQHELNWSNRMILGDSLVVMNSLIERERLAGQVQCLYMDPPYGIKYQSNFQPGISSKSVKDGNDDDLTREPEMIQAYRDTWELGIHSYLTYLRDRLTVARELLSDSGSIFLQIGEENLHLVHILMDEIFGASNFISLITVQKTMSTSSSELGKVCDYIIWFAKNRELLKSRSLYKVQVLGGDSVSTYKQLEMPDGTTRPLTSAELSGKDSIPSDCKVFGSAPLTSQRPAGAGDLYEYEFEGKIFTPGRGTWKTDKAGLDQLVIAGRILATEGGLYYKRYLDDFGAFPLTNVWTDVVSGFMSDKVYVVQTRKEIVARCILMATDPGDLVLDPTCGSGTTAFVAEQYGRRWITVDTSRVALAIARERILTGVFPYYQLRDETRDVDGGFIYNTLERITLGSIARGDGSEQVPLFDQPMVNKKRVRVSGPFTFEALSRYSVNPGDEAPGGIAITPNTVNHVDTLLEALKTLGIPRRGSKPLKIDSLNKVSVSGSIQAEAIVELDGKQARCAISVGPQFGSITMSQVSDAIRQAIGFDLVVFAGFAVTTDAQEKLGLGKFGSMDVALLLANPDLLVGDLLKNTKASQTFRLYASPDVTLSKNGDGDFVLTVEGVDSFDASTGDVTSFGKNGVQAWFLDDDYDGNVFRVSQAFFPVSNAWEKLSKTFRGTADAKLVEKLHSWVSLPFSPGTNSRVSVRVIADDGNASEIVLQLPEDK